MSEHKWVRSSLAYLSRRLSAAGHVVSAPTVGRVLRRLDYGLHGNTKQVEGSAQPPDRDAQFTYLQTQRQAFIAAGQPVISVDTKKKELLGNFKNAGRTWSQSGEAVNTHDFPSEATGRAVPYGIYDLIHNRGSVYVGLSADTPRFAVEVVAHWWQDAGRAAFPGASELLILADAGGSNSARARVWKHQLQEQVCDRFGLSVTVGHYPTGCSKWNPIEHRLFGPISSNWAGQPLRTVETMLGHLRGTTTATGLQVRAERQAGEYPLGEKVSAQAMASLHLTRPATCPAWNYTLTPRTRAIVTADPSAAEPELISLTTP
jgi:Rhodopirellula transposase DDE domain